MSAVAVLRTIGETTLVTSILPAGTADEALAALAQSEDWIIVTHDRDFRGRLSKRFKKLSRVQLRCAEPLDADRLRTAASLIQNEWALLQERREADKSARMVLEISTTIITTIR